MRKIVLFTLIYLLSIALPITVGAEESKNPEERYIIKDNTVVDVLSGKEYGAPFTYTEDGKKVKASLKDLRDMLNGKDKTKVKKNKTSKNSGDLGTAYHQEFVYEETYTYDYWGDSFAISAWLSCPSGNTSCTIKSTTGWSSSETFSSNVEGGWKDYIRVGASFSWTDSVTRSTEYTLPIEGGKTGRIRFGPLFNVTYGDYKVYTYGELTSSEVVRGYSPASVAGTGEPDGMYYVEYY